jgi:hypothetical protein
MATPGPQPVPVTAFKRILEYIRIGSQIETAVSACGYTRQALFYWLREGAAARTLRDEGKELTERQKKLLTFHEQMDVAIAESELRDLERIDKAGDTQWQALAWKLERRYPHKYALRQTITQENLNIDLATLTNEQLVRLYNGEPLSTVLSQPATKQD